MAVVKVMELRLPPVVAFGVAERVSAIATVAIEALVAVTKARVIGMVDIVMVTVAMVACMSVSMVVVVAISVMAVVIKAMVESKAILVPRIVMA